MSAVLGLDIGTSSVRALVYDRKAQPLEGISSHRGYLPDYSADGGATVDGNTLMTLTFDALDEIGEQCRRHGVTVHAVGTSCFWHSLMLLDSNQRPLTPVLLWADTRPESVVSDLARSHDSNRLRRSTGAGLHASYWPAKLRWLKIAEIEALRSAAHIVSFVEFLYFRLLGGFSVSVSMASGTGLLNLESCQWDDFALSSLPPGCNLKLSAIDDEPLGPIRQNFQKRWPCLATAQWYPAFGDGACSNVGVGAIDPSRFAITVGTSSAVRLITEQPVGQPVPLDLTSTALWNYRVDKARGVVGGALSEGGNLIAWLHSNLNLPPLTQIEEIIGKRPPDAGRITILPFIAGQRSPDWIGSARATVSGLGLDTTAVDILQAAMESIAYQLWIVYEALVAAVGRPEEIIGSGAALGLSPVWTQIIANVLGQEIGLSRIVESSSRGAAALVLARIGAAELEALSPRIQKRFPPCEDQAAYAAAKARQSGLYEELLRPLTGTLS